MGRRKGGYVVKDNWINGSGIKSDVQYRAVAGKIVLTH